MPKKTYTSIQVLLFRSDQDRDVLVEPASQTLKVWLVVTASKQANFEFYLSLSEYWLLIGQRVSTNLKLSEKLITSTNKIRYSPTMIFFINI